MTVDNKKAKRKPGGGRKKSKPDYNPSAILQNQMDTAVALYSTADHPSLQTIVNELDLNPIKVRKLLITAGVYKSDAADQVQKVFGTHRKAGLSHTEAIAATMRELHLSKASVTSYLPYEKGVYFPAKTDNKNLSVGAERIRRMRKREKILEELRAEHSEEALWAAVIAFQGYKFSTYGLCNLSRGAKTRVCVLKFLQELLVFHSTVGRRTAGRQTCLQLKPISVEFIIPNRLENVII